MLSRSPIDSAGTFRAIVHVGAWIFHRNGDLQEISEASRQRCSLALPA